MDLDAARHMWDRGDYRVVGDWFASASRACLDDLDLADKRLLDVACGTGAVAIEAARRGAEVVGLDLTPSMLDEARRRAADAGVTLTLAEGSFTDLSGFRGFDIVTSAFGVVFAPDPAAMAARLLDTVVPGGHVRVAGWHRSGAFGRLPEGMVDLLPELAQAPDSRRWTDPVDLKALLAGTDAGPPSVRVDEVRFPFRSAEDGVAQLREHSGPWMALFDQLGRRGRTDEGIAALASQLRPFLTEDEQGGTYLPVAYGVARLRRLPTAPAPGCSRPG